MKLVLKHNKYFIESSHPEVLQRLLKDDVIRDSRVLVPQEGEGNADGLVTSRAPRKSDIVIAGTKPAVPDPNNPGSSTAEVPKAPGDDLFASIVGVQSGAFRTRSFSCLGYVNYT